MAAPISPLPGPTTQPSLPQIGPNGQQITLARSKAAKTEAEADSTLRFIVDAFRAAQEARQTGDDSVEDRWDRNWDAYNVRVGDVEKAEWQADERIPSVPNFVDRFAASLRGALTNSAQMYEFEDPLDRQGVIEPIARGLVDYHLSRCGTGPGGHPVSFEHVFGIAVKAGALSRMAFSVLPEQGRIRIDPVNAKELFYDPENRGLFRIRRRIVDAHRLEALGRARRQNANGEFEPLFNQDAIQAALDGAGSGRSAQQAPGSERPEDLQSQRDRQTGERTVAVPRRKTLEILEFLGTTLDERSGIMHERAFAMVADEKHLIRGSETNPFWHQQDWIVSAPVISKPFSLWGGAYADHIVDLYDTFRNLTNMLLDGVAGSALPELMAWPDLVEHPEKLNEGATPGGVHLAAKHTPINAEFIRAIDKGRVSPEAFTVWSAIQRELREAASQSEVALGQTSPGEKTATEIDQSTAGTRALMQHVAKDIEELVLDPTLALVWSTALQHLNPQDRELHAKIGDAPFTQLVTRRAEYLQRNIRLRVRGISGVLRREQQLRGVLQLFQILGQSEPLMAAYASEFSVPRTVEEVIRGLGLDAERIRKSDEEKTQDAEAAKEAQAQEQLSAALGGAGGGGGARRPAAPAAPGAPGAAASPAATPTGPLS